LGCDLVFILNNATSPFSLKSCFPFIGQDTPFLAEQSITAMKPD